MGLGEKGQECLVVQCVAAWLDVVGLLGLGEGLSSTECHICRTGIRTIEILWASWCILGLNSQNRSEVLMQEIQPDPQNL